jgi:hypothetical protein
MAAGPILVPPAAGLAQFFLPAGSTARAL